MGVPIMAKVNKVIYRRLYFMGVPIMVKVNKVIFKWQLKNKAYSSYEYFKR